MDNKLWEKFTESDFLLGLYFPLLQTLDPEEVIVLCEIIAEYNYACANNFNIEENFLIDFKRFSDFLLLGDDVIIKALEKFQELELITFCTPIDDRTIFMWVREDNIITFLEYSKNEYMPHKWDWELKNAQNPEKQNVSFSEPISNLIQFIDNNMKSPNKIPTITYIYCDMVLKFYNMDKINFIDNVKFQDLIYRCINDKNFKYNDLPTLLVNLGEKFSENSLK